VASVVPISNDSAVVSIDGDELSIDNLRTMDPEVLSVMREADDLVAAAHGCLGIGARAMRAARVSVDSAVVEKAFDELAAAFKRQLEVFAREVAGTAEELLDAEEGDLPKALTGFKQEVESLLDETFDPQSKQSAVAKIETAMAEAGRQQVSAVRKLIDPENEESPLARYRSEIVKTVEKQAAAVLGAVEELKTQLRIEQAKADVFEQTAAKGFSFEDQLEAALTEIAAGFEDVAERVGGTSGGKDKKGDFVVKLNSADTSGEEARYVIEAKDTPKKLPEILKELDGAIDNRVAVAGIAVFARAGQSPVKSPFQTFGDKAIVVFDKDEPNDLALRLACCWARWVARRQLTRGGDEIDLARVHGLIDGARQGLSTVSKIRAALNGSKTQIDRALGHVATLVADVETALQGLEDELAA
jgi:hypothetical protein